jgi:hypothetical protein
MGFCHEEALLHSLAFRAVRDKIAKEIPTLLMA